MIVAASVLASVCVAPAQDSERAKFERKIAEPWVRNGGWTTDFDRAKASADKADALIFAYFTRSYAP